MTSQLLCQELLHPTHNKRMTAQPQHPRQQCIGPHLNISVPNLPCPLLICPVHCSPPPPPKTSILIIVLTPHTHTYTHAAPSPPPPHTHTHTQSSLESAGLRGSALGRPDVPSNPEVPDWLKKWAALTLQFVHKEKQLLPGVSEHNTHPGGGDVHTPV